MRPFLSRAFSILFLTVLIGALKAEPVKGSEASVEEPEKVEKAGGEFAPQIFLSFSQKMADYNCQSETFISAVSQVLENLEVVSKELKEKNLNGRLMVRFTVD